MLSLSQDPSPGSGMQVSEEQAERGLFGFSLHPQSLACAPCTLHAALKWPILPPRSHMPFPKLELGLGSRPAAPRELPTCSICLEKLREPVSLDCGHDFCTRCFSTHRVPGCQPPCCPECRKICKQKKGLRSLGEKMKLLPQRPPPPVLQVGGPGLIAGQGAWRDPGPVQEGCVALALF